MTIEELDLLLDARPIMAEVHPASLLYLRAVPHVINDPVEMLQMLDAPSLAPEERCLLFSKNIGNSFPGQNEAQNALKILASRLPNISVAHDPFGAGLNALLPGGYEFLRSQMLCQSGLAEQITQEAASLNPQHDRVVTLWVDGLSYAEARDFPGCEPCLVDGPTITPSGFDRLVGDPPLAARLLQMGFTNRLGFSYWQREDNNLANHLFRGIAQMHRARGFDDVLRVLDAQELRGAYIQIVRDGLDHLSHARQRETPAVEASVTQLHSHLMRLTDVLKSKPGRTLLYVASDHGLLWKHKAALQPLETASRSTPPRYYDYNPQNGHTTPLSWNDTTTHALHFPITRRALAIDEAGCHGGLSYEESIIPFCRIALHKDEA